MTCSMRNSRALLQVRRGRRATAALNEFARPAGNAIRIALIGVAAADGPRASPVTPFWSLGEAMDFALVPASSRKANAATPKRRDRVLTRESSKSPGDPGAGGQTPG